MTFLISIAMIIILIAINVALICFVISLNIQFYKEKETYKINSDLLKKEIFDVTKEQTFLVNKTKLSDDLDNSLKESNNSLNKKIYGLNYHLFDMIYKN